MFLWERWLDPSDHAVIHATNDCSKVDEVNTVCFFSGCARAVLSCFMTGGMRSSRSLPQMLPCRRHHLGHVERRLPLLAGSMLWVPKTRFGHN